MQSQEPDITVVITSCARHDLLARTLESFRRHETEGRVGRIIVAEDGDSNPKEVCARFGAEYFCTGERVGQIRLIDSAYALVTTPYIFHLEDDWEFYRPGFMERSRKILETDPSTLVVLLRAWNDTNGMPLGFRAVDRSFGVMSLNHLGIWHGFTFNPGLRRLSDYRRLGNYANQTLTTGIRPKVATAALPYEAEAGRFYYVLGYRAAILDETGYVRHIGEERHVTYAADISSAKGADERSASALETLGAVTGEPALARFPLNPAELTNLKDAATKFVLPGYAPSEPFIRPDSPFFAAGSCFAQSMAHTLTQAGATITFKRIEEGINTPLQTERLFSAIARREDKDSEALHDRLQSASLLVLTLGGALQMHLNGAPVFEWDTARGPNVTWQMLSLDQVVTSLRATIEAVQHVNPLIHIALSLSALPLGLTPHPSVFGEDCISKSTLRLGIAAILKDQISNVSYWPSFEIVRGLAGYVGPLLAGGQDTRHLPAQTHVQVTQLFAKRYFMKNQPA
jgi:hypothetical protein